VNPLGVVALCGDPPYVGGTTGVDACVQVGATYARAVTAYGPAQKDGAAAALWVGGWTVYTSFNVVKLLGLAVLACVLRWEPPMHVQSLRTGLHKRMVQRLHCGWVAGLSAHECGDHPASHGVDVWVGGATYARAVTAYGPAMDSAAAAQYVGGCPAWLHCAVVWMPAKLISGQV
jgi:hypothetical protein